MLQPCQINKNIPLQPSILAFSTTRCGSIDAQLNPIKYDHVELIAYSEP